MLNCALKRVVKLNYYKEEVILRRILSEDQF